MGGNIMKKLILFLIVAVLASCSAPQKGYNYKHHSSRQQTMYKQTKQATTYLGINFRDPQLKNLKVRQALVSAIDIKSILKYV